MINQENSSVQAKNIYKRATATTVLWLATLLTVLVDIISSLVVNKLAAAFLNFQSIFSEDVDRVLND